MGRGERVVHGYGDRLSVAPGERIEFKISSEQDGVFQADVVRLISGDVNPAGPGLREVPIDTDTNGTYPARFQSTDPGSFVVVEDRGALALMGPLTLQAFICPTTPEKSEQVVIGRFASETGVGYALTLGGGRLGLMLGGTRGRVAVEGEGRLHAWCWYSVAVSFDPAQRLARVYCRPVITSVNSRLSPIVPVSGDGVWEREVDADVDDCGAAVVIGGCWTSASSGVVDAHFNGKIDSPKLWSRVLSVEELDAVTAGASPPPEGLEAQWDFAAGIEPEGIATDRVVDTGPHGLDGRCVQFPARGMTGWNWGGVEERFVHAPQEFGAIHFHEDDLEDCEWETDIAWTVPQALPSGVYALRLRQGESEDRIPFFVLPPRGQATAKALLLIPTASYLAYANEHFNDQGYAQALYGRTGVIGELDLWSQQHREFGASTYDSHRDGSGVHYSSLLRPIINLRPQARMAAGPWQFPADLHLVAWLETQGFEYDVATDRELQDEGAELLSRYTVVMTGSHPEYYSAEMLDAWERYLGAGGRGMYLGGNGFYWVIAWHPTKRHLIEVRRGEYGTRAWQANPGEYCMQSNGQRSGLWRGRARAPQKTFGTGFAAQGSDESSYFVQMPDARDPRAAFIMDGVSPEERIGEFGLVGGGAAGIELDRYDLSLGTPPHSLLLAYSEGHSDNYPRVVEELYNNLPMMTGTMDPNVRADIVYFTTKSGGAVFSTSSIAWCGSLLHNDGDNNVSRITANVLRRFRENDPLPPLENNGQSS